MWEEFYFPAILVTVCALAALAFLTVKAIHSDKTSTRVLIGVFFIGAAIFGFYYASEIYKETFIPAFNFNQAENQFIILVSQAVKIGSSIAAVLGLVIIIKAILDGSNNQYNPINSTGTRFCSHCGQPAQSETSFCNRCGKQLNL